jgi:putative ABC transport system permease protein
MLINYLLVRLRSVLREKLRFIIEVVSLCLGLTCFLLTLSFVDHEGSYDSFHAHSGEIHRLTDPWGKPGNYTRPAILPSPWAEVIKEHFPEIGNYTRVRKMLRFTPMLSVGEVSSFESNFIGVDSTFFEVFSFRLSEGNPATALGDPGTIILSADKARKYFGDRSPLGETILFDNRREYTVTGVMAPIPSNSHLHFDFVIRIEPVPRTASVYSYFQITPGTDINALESKLKVFLKEAFGSSYPNQEYEPRFQKLTDIHLSSTLDYEFEPNGNANYTWLLLIIGIAALVISVFNYLNVVLSALSSKTKEWNIRRSLGGGRMHRIIQLSLDTTVVCVIALILCVLVTKATFPLFTEVSKVTTTWIEFAKGSILAVACWMIAVPLLAGALGALVIGAADFRNATQYRSFFSEDAAPIRNILVVLQLTVSMALLVCVFVIGDQLNFIRKKELGFDKSQVLVINARVDGGLDSYSGAIRNKFESIPGVDQVSFSQTVPGDFGMASISYTIDSEIGAAYPMTTNFVDQNYLKTLGVNLFLGRDFDSASTLDSSAYIINRSAMKRLNWPDIDNRFIRSGIDDKINGPVIGVINDFHFESLHSEIEPMVLCINPLAWNKVIVRLNSINYQSTIDQLAAAWKTVLPAYPFQYTFLDDQFEKLYDADRSLSLLFSSFTIMAIILTCTGVYSMVGTDTTKRIKEIAIRKTLGASVMAVTWLLLRRTTFMCILAIGIGAPISWFLMQDWLANFAYTVDLSLITLVAGGLVIVVVSSVTSITIVLRAANANPTAALRQL